MDQVNYIALAIPFFFLLIGLELWISIRKQKRVYRFSDSVTDLSCGVWQQITRLFFASSLLFLYFYVYENSRFLTWKSDQISTWIFTFFAVDFIYYWWHRVSHEVNLFWAAHIVHHQSEDYNLAVALRQAILTQFTSAPFYLPLAFLGIPPLVFFTIQSFSTLYQFWIHTQLIGKLGRWELLLNTPSHHRVHHAINPQYIDKNYGATLIVWDRIFGTFAEEKEAPVYGLVKPLRSFNSLFAQFHYVFDLYRDSLRAKGVWDSLKVWFISPQKQVASLPEKPRAPKVSPDTFVKYNPVVTSVLNYYISFHFLLLNAGVFCLLMWGARLSFFWLSASAILVYLTLLVFGGLFEQKPWAFYLEVFRLVYIAVFAVLCSFSAVVSFFVIVGVLTSLVCLRYAFSSATSIDISKKLFQNKTI